jgi:uncharacterized protein YlxW (UPF0749 family)
MRPTPAPHPRADGSGRLLVELVLNPQDPGYAEATARRRAAGLGRRWYDGPAVVIGSLLIGFTLVLGYVHTHRSAPEAATVHDGLVARVRAAEQSADALARQVNSVSAQVNSVRNVGLSGSAALADVLDRDLLLAGQTAVVGPGLQVTLAEPPAPTPTTDPGQVGPVVVDTTNILTDRDVRSVVNELWSDGAEAISVNGIRLGSTSAVRFAGQVILVDFQPITSPYTVRAIGNADGLATGFASSQVASRYATQASANGIGFVFTEHRRLTLPASAAVTLRYARVPRSGK